jgi:MFS family permease
VWGAQADLLGDAVSFLCVAILVARLPGLGRASAEASRWGERFRAGLAYVRRNAELRRLIVAQAAAIVFFTLVLPIEVVFAIETLDAGDAGYGALLAAWGVGMVLGAVIFAALRGRTLRSLLAISTAAIGISYLTTAAAPTLAVACAAAVVGGAGNGVQWVALVSAVQELTEDAFQARVVSVLESAASAAPGVGFLAGGAIAVALGPRASFAVAGCGVLAVLALAALALRRASLGERPIPRRIAPEALHSRP